MFSKKNPKRRPPKIYHNLFHLCFLILIPGIFLFSSCKKDKNKTQEALQNTAQSGTWRITYFKDSGRDETYHFTGFNFTFQSSGTLLASNGLVNYSGTWSITDSNSQNNSKDDLHFNIHFNLTNEFEDLNDDWHIKSYTSSQIELVDESGGGGGTDYLTFEKN